MVSYFQHKCKRNYYLNECDKDFRVLWMKDKILNLLNINNNKQWDQMMCRHCNRFSELLLKFLNEKTICDGLNLSLVIMIVFKSCITRQVAKDVYITKIVIRVKPQTRRKSTQSNVTINLQWLSKKYERKFIMNAKDNAKMKTKSKNKTFTKKLLKRHNEFNHKAQGSANKKLERKNVSQKVVEYVKIKRVMKLKRFKQQLHGYFKVPEHIDKDTKYVYIIKKENRPFPKFDTYEEAEAQMAYYIHLGTFNGRYARSTLESLKALFLYMRLLFVHPSSFSLTNTGSLLDLNLYSHFLFLKKLVYEFSQNLTEVQELMNLEFVFVPKILCLNNEKISCEMLRLEESILFNSFYVDIFFVTHDTAMNEKLNILYSQADTLQTVLYGNIINAEYGELVQAYRIIRNDITKHGLDLSSNINELGSQLFKKRFAHSIYGVIEALLRFYESSTWKYLLVNTLNFVTFTLLSKSAAIREKRLAILASHTKLIKVLRKKFQSWIEYLNHISRNLEKRNFIDEHFIYMIYKTFICYLTLWPLFENLYSVKGLKNVVRTLYRAKLHEDILAPFFNARNSFCKSMKYYYKVIEFLRPILEVIKIILLCPRISYLEPGYKIITAYSHILKCFRDTELNCVNYYFLPHRIIQVFDFNSIIKLIQNRLCVMYDRLCHILFFVHGPRLRLKGVNRFAKIIPKVVDFYKFYLYDDFTSKIFGKTETIAACKKPTNFLKDKSESLSRVTDVLRCCKQVLVTLMPGTSKIVIYYNIIKTTFREIVVHFLKNSFYIYTHINKNNEHTITDFFLPSLKHLGNMTVNMIHMAFHDLESSIAALKYLKYLQKLKEKEFFQEILLSKFPKILVKFVKEMQEYLPIFIKYCVRPFRILQLPFNSSRLFCLRFIASHPSSNYYTIMNAPEVSDRALHYTAERWKNFYIKKAAMNEMGIFTCYMNSNVRDLEQFVKMTCIRIEGDNKDENFNDSVCGSEIEFINSTTSKIKFFGDRLMMELNCRFRLNYDKSFEHFIPELHHFKLLGYNIPEVLCRLLKESRGIGFRLNTIEMLLAQYRDFCFTKPKHIVMMLKGHIMPIELQLFYGVKELTWGQVWMQCWVHAVTLKITDLKRKFFEVERFRMPIIEQLIELRCHRLKMPKKEFRCHKFFELMSSIINFKTRSIKMIQMKIGKYLEYIEWFLYDTQTRRHKYFVMYYNLVELRFKYNLSICLLDNLKVYEMWLLGHFSLLNLKLILSPDGLIYDPDIKQLLSNTNEFLFNMIYGFGRLPRWMSESALTVPRAVSEKYGTARKERNQDIGSDCFRFQNPKLIRNALYSIKYVKPRPQSNWFNIATTLENFNEEIGKFVKRCNKKYSLQLETIDEFKQINVRTKMAKLWGQYYNNYYEKTIQEHEPNDNTFEVVGDHDFQEAILLPDSRNINWIVNDAYVNMKQQIKIFDNCKIGDKKLLFSIKVDKLQKEVNNEIEKKNEMNDAMKFQSDTEIFRNTSLDEVEFLISKASQTTSLTIEDCQNPLSISSEIGTNNRTINDLSDLSTTQSLVQTDEIGGYVEPAVCKFGNKDKVCEIIEISEVIEKMAESETNIEKYNETDEDNEDISLVVSVNGPDDFDLIEETDESESEDDSEHSSLFSSTEMYDDEEETKSDDIIYENFTEPSVFEKFSQADPIETTSSTISDIDVMTYKSSVSKESTKNESDDESVREEGFLEQNQDVVKMSCDIKTANGIQQVEYDKDKLTEAASSNKIVEQKIPKKNVRKKIKDEQSRDILEIVTMPEIQSDTMAISIISLTQTSNMYSRVLPTKISKDEKLHTLENLLNFEEVQPVRIKRPDSVNRILNKNIFKRQHDINTENQWIKDLNDWISNKFPIIPGLMPGDMKILRYDPTIHNMLENEKENDVGEYVWPNEDITDNECASLSAELPFGRTALQRKLHRFTLMEEVMKNKIFLQTILKLENLKNALSERLYTFKVRLSDALYSLQNIQSWTVVCSSTSYLADLTNYVQYLDNCLYYLYMCGYDVYIGCMRVNYRSVHQQAMFHLHHCRKLAVDILYEKILLDIASKLPWYKETIDLMKTNVASIEEYLLVMETIKNIEQKGCYGYFDLCKWDFLLRTLRLFATDDVSLAEVLLRTACNAWTRIWRIIKKRKYYLSHSYYIFYQEVKVIVKDFNKLCTELANNYISFGPASKDNYIKESASLEHVS